MTLRGRGETGRSGMVLLLAALTGITALAIDMSLPAMPELQRAFGAGVAGVQLTLSLFLAGYALGQVVCGPASDRLGRRPVLLAGIALFVAAGLACAASPTLDVLVAGRFVQGLGASVGPILARAIVRDRFAEQDASGVLSQITQVMIAAPLLAPTVGAFLLGHFGWRSIFVVLVGAGLLIGTAAALWLPETRRPPGPGVTLPSPVRGYLRVLSPGPGLWRVLTACISYMGLFAYVSGSPFVLIEAFGVPRAFFGLLFAFPASALLAGATLNRVLVRRIPSALLLRRGVLLVFAGGVGVTVLAALRLGGPAGMLGPMMLYTLGMGLLQPNAVAAAMAPHPDLAGVTSSAIGSLQTAGGALAGLIVGAFYDGTSRSLAFTVGVMALLTLVVHRTGAAGPDNARPEDARTEADGPPLAPE